MSNPAAACPACGETFEIEDFKRYRFQQIEELVSLRAKLALAIKEQTQINKECLALNDAMDIADRALKYAKEHLCVEGHCGFARPCQIYDALKQIETIGGSK